jgi:hypothetical protein
VRASRLLGLLAAVATAVLIAPAPALAEPYPAEPPASSISEAEVADGGTVTFRGEGFLPGETIAITINYGGSDSNAAARATAGRFVPAAMPLRRQADLTVTASSAGTFSVTLKLTEVGSATLVATGLTSGVTVTQTVEVVAPSEHDDGASGGGGGDDEDTTTCRPPAPPAVCCSSASTPAWARSWSVPPSSGSPAPGGAPPTEVRLGRSGRSRRDRPLSVRRRSRRRAGRRS